MPKDKQEEGAGTAPDDLPDNLEEMARRYVDLWQDQMTALAADPEFAESLQKVMAAMGVGAAGLPAMWSAWPAAMTSLMAAAQPGMTKFHGQETHGEPSGGEPAGGKHNGGQAAPAGTSSGAPPAAAASDGGGDDLGGLEERLAALEQRIRSLEGTLEGGTGRTRGRAKGKPKRD